MGSKKGGLFRYADGVDKLLMLFGTLGSIGDGLMSPLNMFVLSGVIDEYAISNQSISNKVVDKYALRLLYVALGVGVSAFLEGLCWTRTAERQTSRIRMEYLRSVLRQEVGFFDNQDASSSTTFKVVSTISADAHSIQDVISEKIPNCLVNLSAFIFGLLVAFLLSWRLALASLPCALCFIAPGVGFGKLMMKLQTKSKDSYEESMKLGIKQGFAKGLMIGSMGMVYAAWAFESWAGSVLVIERGESGGRVFIAAVCVVLGGLSCMSALPNVSFIVEASAAATRIFEMIDRIPEIDSEDGKGKVLSHVNGEIEFKDVYFSYPSRKDTPILQGLNLKVKAGKTVGLVGGSGSGKSTIIALLERFYDPIKGDILLDGHRIKRFKHQWLRSQIGLVNQEPILFATSIKENILFGKEDASMEQVINAAKAANAHDFIIKLPGGYETQVGQFGFQLSGGQKQRIAIARALLKNPRILLLDEATSALDTQSERIVQDAIDKASQGRTTIVIAHRLTTIRNSDTIVVLDSGRVIESGPHDKLMQINNGEGGVYLKMVKLQQSVSEETEASSRLSHSIDARIQKRAINGSTPYSVRTSWQNSPASPFSPAFTMSVVPSINMISYYNSDDETLDATSSPTLSQWQLIRMNAPEWKRGLLGCLGASGFGAVQPINAYCLGSVVSVYFNNDKSRIKSETSFYAMIFTSIAVISFFANLLQHHNFAIMGERLTKRIRERVLGNILTFEIGWFDQDDNTSAAVCARLSTEANVVRCLVGDRLFVINSGLHECFCCFYTWTNSNMESFHSGDSDTAFDYRELLLEKHSDEKNVERAQKEQNEGSQLASEAVFNHRTITAFSSQRKILQLFAETLKNPRKESVKQSWFSGIGLFVSQFLTTASIALTYWYGGRLMNKGLVSSKHLFQAFFHLDEHRKSEIEPENRDGLKVKKGLKGRIDLSGKSTVIGLIERFYDPIKGSVLIDDQDIKSYNLRDLRSHIALVSQEPTLFAGTVHENIVYGKENATESEIRKAAVLANAHEFIRKRSQLSGGQKQRIVLARAILKNPSILLLGEATSALDSMSENLVQEALEKMMVGRTCVIVAHRLSTIQKADCIAVIRNGKVVEKGSHSELLDIGNRGSYYSLINSQHGHSDSS
ncbi:hypothetical protein DH2020_003724 [Rehmannia glutinosa]|uniref:Uncharacterized protein n=1 Tax=Rehmannia glutinosa TaxID=99300 RepID=A0ABR0XMJ3_REHGL